VASRTQIVCLCEDKHGKSIDPIFINRLLKSLKPGWVRSWSGSNWVRFNPCGSRRDVIEKMPNELQACNEKGSDTTLMVFLSRL